MTQFNAILLSFYVEDPATFLPSLFWGPYFPLRTAYLFSCGTEKYFKVCIITSLRV